MNTKARQAGAAAANKEDAEDAAQRDPQGKGHHEEIRAVNAKLLAESRANMARLDEIVRLAEEASPKLRRRGERFARSLSARQDRAFARILARPGSKAYRDYVETPARFGVAP